MWERIRTEGYKDGEDGSISSSLSRVEVGGSFHLPQLLRSAALGWDAPLWKQDIKNLGKVVTRPWRKQKVGERFKTWIYASLYLCDCHASTLLQELTEAKASQDPGLELAVFAQLCTEGGLMMLTLMCGPWKLRGHPLFSVLSTGLLPIFVMQNRWLQPLHSFGDQTVKLWICLFPQHCKGNTVI